MMALFRRKRSRADDVEEQVEEPTPTRSTASAGSGPDADGTTEAGEVQDETSDAVEDLIGPWDLEEQPELGARVDLGALRVPKRPGLQIRMEVDKKTRRVVAVNVALDGSALQLQAFAAPRSEGLWQDLRGELATQVGKQGGSVQERIGTFGDELLARLPVRMPDGRTGHRPARFLGVDGPRWFLRGVLTGKAMVNDQHSADMEAIFGDVVVVRGEQARAPRDLLPLHLPGQRQQPTDSGRPSLELPRRGPEITETR
ncbi:DUF3710 domain-containing protein [Ruania albidiflava]|uniref:DUF3710 domain-containing protein n=1 Tax=Ruania albidiflava TaxID=366586 RepID=UPI0003FE3998|nr:DUF3710 domain-containing protein [Ruania albidiflava]